MTIRVIINGANGKMGQVTASSIANESDLLLVAELSRQDDLASSIIKHKADVVIDFTVPQSVFSNAQAIIANKARPVIGTTGLSVEQIDILKKQCQQQSLGGIIAPNFSLGAILMMKYAQDAAKYFEAVEIIEMHHPQKIDAPSGTAKKTAEMIAEVREMRGKLHQDVPIHSVRLPGLFAHQVVMFGGKGETLTIRHDATDRAAMMPGVFLACRKVMEMDYLVYGLENIL